MVGLRSAPLANVSPSSRRLLLIVLAACLVGAQALGFAHRVLHAGGTAPVPPAQQQAETHAHGAQDLFGHDDAGECRLFDALAQGGPLPAAQAVALPPPADDVIRATAGEAVARWAALFQARGPPAVS